VRLAQTGEDAQTWGASNETRKRLAQAIQTELRRVGCYHGNIDGDWDADSRRAMKAFNDRVNASLPVTQADYILLTLLQGHAAKVCGTVCPSGQALADDGTCQPRSVLTEARRRAAQSLPSSARPPGEPSSWATAAAGIAASIASIDRGQQAAGRTPDIETEVQPQRKARADEARARSERELIAAAEERKRQRVAEAWARAEAERLARIGEAERTRAAAEARRREEMAAIAAREVSLARPPAEPAAPRSPPPLSAAQGGASGGAVAMAFAEMPPTRASDNTTSHGLTRPAEARFVGRFLPPPTYRVGRLPPSPRPRVEPPAVRVQAPPPAPGRAARLQLIFKSVERNSP
jgi:hypothetical protein